MIDRVRVVVVPADETGCGTYRLIHPARAVQTARPGWQVEVYRPNQIQLRHDTKGRLTGLRGLPDPARIDLLVMQRVGTQVATQFLAWASRNGIATALDVDDAMWAIDRHNKAYATWNSRNPLGLHWRHLDAAAETVDLVTVTTPALARHYGGHGRVEILPNHVPRTAVEVPSIRDEYDPRATIGWMGYTTTHPRDLRVVGTAVADVLDQVDGLARVIGDATGAARDWGLDTARCVKDGPYRLGPDLYTAMTACDVAVVPAEDNTFTRGKSWLKALEYSAVGVPVIASPTPANRALAGEIPILLAETPDEWRSHLTWLLTDPEEARRRGTEARKLVERDWLVDDAGELWAAAWERAISRRRSLG